MIHVKIYDKGRDETQIYTKCRCPRQQIRAKVGDKKQIRMEVDGIWN